MSLRTENIRPDPPWPNYRRVPEKETLISLLNSSAPRKQSLMTTQIISTICSLTSDLLSADGRSSDSIFDETTILMGAEGLLDSIDLVNLVVSVEQYIEDTHNLTITIADEKAMSQNRSPFKTIGNLARYVEILIDEKNQK